MMLAQPALYNLPEEMRSRRQWCVATLEPISDGKLDKSPWSPDTGFRADTTNPQTWSDFQTCVDAVINGVTNANGVPFRAVGYCIAEDDGLTCFDLDDYFKSSTEQQRQIAVFFGSVKYDGMADPNPSYTERSQSGSGLHIWVHGKSGSYVNHDMGIEIYDRERFIICTGDCAPTLREINPGNFTETISAIARHMAMRKLERLPDVVWSEADEPDNVIIGKITGAKTWPKIAKYAEFGYPSNADRSQVDIEIAGHIAGFTQSPYQFARIFRQLFPLCWRPEKRRTEAKYVEDYLINRTFAKVVAADQAKALAKQREAEANAAAVITEAENGTDNLPPITAFPPGMVGEMAQLFYDRAPRQIREVALGGALVMWAGLVGRNYVFRNSGLNLYVAVTAGTGTGKNAAAMGIRHLMREIEKIAPNIAQFKGDDRIASGPGLIKMLQHYPGCFVIFGEFGHDMRAMLSPRAASHEQEKRKILLDLFTNSGPDGSVSTGAYSDRKNHTPVTVASPAFSFLGDTTPDVYYETFNSGVAQEGFLPRLLTIAYTGERPKPNDARGVDVPQDMIEKLKWLIEEILIPNRGVGEKLDCMLKFFPVDIAPEADAALKAFRDHCDTMINSTPSGSMIRTLWTRAEEKAARIAALIAVGVNPTTPVIDVEAWQWGEFLARRDIGAFEYYSATGLVGSNVTRQLPLIIEWAREYVKSSHDRRVNSFQVSEACARTGAIPYTYFYKRARVSKEFTDGLRGGDLGKLVRTILGEAVENDYLERMDENAKKLIKGMRSDADVYLAGPLLAAGRR